MEKLNKKVCGTICWLLQNQHLLEVVQILKTNVVSEEEQRNITELQEEITRDPLVVSAGGLFEITSSYVTTVSVKLLSLNQ